MVSIILPCYKAERFLSNIVHDIFSQTYKDWQLIAVSNGQGQEPQLQLLRQLQQEAPDPDRIIILSEEQGNVSNARNVGMDHATGEWLTFVDADDRVDPDHLQLLVDATLTGDPDIIVSGYTAVDPKRRRPTRMQPCEKEMMISKRELIRMPDAAKVLVLMNPVWSQMYRSSFVKSHAFRFDTAFTYCEDTIFSFQCLLATDRIKLIPLGGYRYCYNATSTVQTYNPTFEKAAKTLRDYRRRIFQAAGVPDEEIAVSLRRHKYDCTLFCFGNLFLPGSPFTTFGSKVREVRRLIFDDPEARAAIEAQDRHAHARFDRFLGFDLAYDLRSPRYMVFQRQFLVPLIAAYRFRIRERFFPPKE